MGREGKDRVHNKRLKIHIAILSAAFLVFSCKNGKETVIENEQPILSKPKESVIITDINVYRDIDLFRLQGIEKIDSPKTYPYIKVEPMGPKAKRVVYKSSQVDSVEKIYKFEIKYWTTFFEYKADTGYCRIYEFIMPGKIVELEYLGTYEKKDFHLHDASIIDRKGSRTWGFGGDKGIKAEPHPDRLNDVQKVANTFFKDYIYEKNGKTINVWSRVDTAYGYSSYIDSNEYKVTGRSWHWIKQFGWEPAIK